MGQASPSPAAEPAVGVRGRGTPSPGFSSSRGVSFASDFWGFNT